MKISLSKRHIKTSHKLGKLRKFKQHFPKNMKFHHQDMYDMGNNRIQHSMYFGGYGLGGYGGYPGAFLNVTRNANDPDMDGDVHISPVQGTSTMGGTGDFGGTVNYGSGDSPSAG